MVAELYSAVTKLQGFSLSQEQADNIAMIYDAFVKHGGKRKRHIAYIIATAYHEGVRKEKMAGKTILRRIVSVEEIGKGKGKPYGSKIKYNKNAYATPDKLYYGRGYVQLTWYEVYEKFGKILGVDLLNNPELALDSNVAADIIVIGMIKGLFTGVRLENYFNDTKTDAVNARRIINILDSAELISGYYKVIFNAIKDLKCCIK